MSSQSLEKYVVLVSGAVGICAAFYFMRSRRKGKVFITKNVSIPSKNKYEMSSAASSGVTVSDEGDSPDVSKLRMARIIDHTDSVCSTDSRDEQLNIGFGSDPCWTNKTTRDSKEFKSERRDLLHTGNSKGGKLVVVLVGLPGSGKTYIARKVSRYLRWISYRTRVFSIAKYRLEKVGTKKANFFDPENQSNYQMRVKLMMHAVSEAMKYLNKDGEIAIIDGTNYCRSRRDLIRERVSQEEGFEILWIESVISSGNYSPESIAQEVNLCCMSNADEERLKSAARNNKSSPDYMDKEDFNKRMNYYKKQYETLADDEGSYIRTHDSGKTLNLHLINGYLRTKIASFVMNLTAIHATNRPIYMTRAGETQFIKKGLIGGDSELTASGIEFAKALGDFLQFDDTDFVSSSSSSKPSPKNNSPSDSTVQFDFDSFGYVNA